METCVSQAMNTEKRPIAKQLLDLKRRREKGFGPTTKADARPTSWRPIKPSKLPNKTPECFNIESFFMLQATKEAPPKIAPVRPKQVGTMVGLIAVARARRGALLIPKPIIPSPNIAFLRGLSTLFMYSIFSVGPIFSHSFTQVGFIQDVEMMPTKLAIIPPIANGFIIMLRAGIDRMVYEVPSAAKKDSHVVVYTFDRNLLTPTFFEIASLVVSEDAGAASKGFWLEKRALMNGVVILNVVSEVLDRVLRADVNILLVIIITSNKGPIFQCAYTNATRTFLTRQTEDQSFSIRNFFVCIFKHTRRLVCSYVKFFCRISLQFMQMSLIINIFIKLLKNKTKFYRITSV